MTDIERRSVFEHHYNRYLASRITVLILHMLFTETGVAVCVFYFGKMVKEYGVQGIKIVLLVVIAAVPIGVFCICFMSVLDYANEILILYQGKIVFEAGMIKKKTRSIYDIEIVRADRVQCSKNKRKKEHGIAIVKRFVIKPRYRESIFQTGDKVTVLYPATRLLQANGFSTWRTNSIPDTYAVYAFRGDPPSNLLRKDRKFSAKQCENTFWTFAIGTAILLIAVICTILSGTV